MREPLQIEGRTLSITNLDKVLYPATGFCKRELLAYYGAVAPVLLPYLRDCALHLGRWPDGPIIRAGCRQRRAYSAGSRLLCGQVPATIDDPDSTGAL